MKTTTSSVCDLFRFAKKFVSIISFSILYLRKSYKNFGTVFGSIITPRAGTIERVRSLNFTVESARHAMLRMLY